MTNGIIVNDLEIYTSDIDIIVDDYINTLPNYDMIFKNTVFTGLIKYINHNKFNLDPSTKLKLCSDIILLNQLWYMYTSIVYKYGHKPTLIEFSLMIGINVNTIYDWSKGADRDEYVEILSCRRSDVVKSWQNESQLGRYKGAEAGNVGCIFLSKAVDGLIETAPQQVIQHVHTRGIDQIAAEHQPQIEDLSTGKADF